MQLSFSDESIEELRKIAEEEFDEPFTHEEARVMADNLLQLHELLSKLHKQP